MLEKIRCKIEADGIRPVRAHKADSGIDIFTHEKLEFRPGEMTFYSSKVKFEVPEGYTAFVKSKSGLFKNKSLFTTGVIDPGYNGEIGIMMINLGKETQFLEAGDKIAQVVILPCETPELEIVDELEETERGSNGFGSTGR